MADINLLPWRAAKRKKTNKIILLVSIIFWTLCLAVGIYTVQLAAKDLSNQQTRNRYLLNQNANLEREIGEIKILQAKKQDLIQRMRVIQELQAGRMQIVHIFDDIVRKLPAGVTLDRMSKRKNEILLKGRAESNSKVSELMTNFNTSQWFGKSDLSTINIEENPGSNLNEFELGVTQKTPFTDGLVPNNSEQ